MQELVGEGVERLSTNRIGARSRRSIDERIYNGALEPLLTTATFDWCLNSLTIYDYCAYE
jgi:hypothetical protein